MKEFIEKLIGRLEEQQNDIVGNTSLHHLYSDGFSIGLECAMETINQLAEEYNNEAVKGDLISKKAVITELNGIYLDNPYDDKEDILEKAIGIVDHFPTVYNNGWIPCSERLPEVSGEYYTYVYYDRHYMYSIDEIDCDGIIKEWNCTPDYQILAWKPIAPYQPKGE